MRYRITHTTQYIYQESVALCHNEAKIFPKNLPNQISGETGWVMEPLPEIFNERVDFFGNDMVYFSIQHPHQKMTITATTEVETLPEAHLQLNLSSNLQWEEVKDMLDFDPSIPLETKQFKLFSPFVPYLDQARELALQCFTPGKSIFEGSYALMQKIHGSFKFVSGYTAISTPLWDVFKNKKGVCQDFAHVAIACLRSLGLSARYVSGYIETLPPVGKEKLVGADASHAWFSVFIPGVGWVDFDPTNNMIPSEKHIVVAWGRDFGDVSPLKGVIFSSGKHELKVSVDVRNLDV